MIRMILVAAALLATSAAQAAPYPSCSQAQATVAARGAAVIRTAPHVFDRYVVHRGFCAPTQIARPTFAATYDNPHCMIGSICVEPDSGGRWRRF